MEREELNYRVLDEINRVVCEIQDLQYELAELRKMCEFSSSANKSSSKSPTKGE